MNKLTKSAIAGAAGIALLLGGAGSLAYWNSSATVSTSTISSGKLEVAINSGAAWNKTITKWVPGDTATYSANITVTAEGDNIKANLAFDTLSLVPPTGTNKLLDALDITFTADTSVSPNLTGSAGVYQITAAGTYVIPVTVTVLFKTTADNQSQLGTLNLTGMKFTVTQV